MCDLLAMTGPAFGQPFRALNLIRSDRMRPRFAEPEFCGSFLCGNFAVSFDYRAKWITDDAGVFYVSVVNPPELTTWLLGCVRFHEANSTQPRSRQM